MSKQSKILTVTPCALPGLLTLRFPYNPALIEHVKNVTGERYPGSSWNSTNKVWTVAQDHLEWVVSRAQRMGFEIVEAKDAATHIDLHPHERFTDYQIRALERLSRQRALLLQWEMGLGKTATAICAADQISGKCLVVAPSNVLSQWETQINLWSQLSKDHLFYTVKANSKFDDDFERAKFVLISYGMLQHLPPMPNLSFLVFDELHYLIHKQSNRSVACRELSLAYPHAYRLGLTATPISSQLYNIHQQLDILCPGRYGTYYQWVTFYHVVDHDGYEGALQIHGLREDRFDDLVRRMTDISDVVTKADAVDRMPPTNWSQEILCNVSTPSTAFSLKNWKVEQQKLSSERAFNVVKFATLQQQRLQAEFKDLEQRPRTLFLTYLRKTCYELAELLNCAAITGELPPKKRLQILRESKLAVVTLRSINEGIELPEFTRIFVVESFPVPLYMAQVLARFVRFGQKNPVYITFLTLGNTSDEIIQQRLLTRLEEQSKLIRTGGLQQDLHNLLAQDENDESFLVDLKKVLTSESADSDKWDCEFDYEDNG